VQSKKAVLVLAIATILAVTMLVPVSASDSDASTVESSDVGYYSEITSLTMAADSQSTFCIIVTNNLPADDTLADERAIKVSVTNSAGSISIDDDDKAFVLSGQEYRGITVTADAGKYTREGNYEINITISYMAIDSEGATTTETYNMDLTVTSSLSSGNAYNKILGYFDNPLPAPFDEPAATAIITFFLWILIGLVAIALCIPIVMHIMVHGGDENINEDKRVVRRIMLKVLFIIVVLFALMKSLYIYGASESLIATLQTWTYILYIGLGTVLVWRTYRIFIKITFARLDRDDPTPDNGQSPSDMVPLFLLLGKLVIAIAAVTLVCSMLGFDMAAIITSAGIVSLGITFGAQNVLGQFFSGIVLLATRPFKKGDLVQIGGSTTTYRVADVSIMMSRFENWDNSDIIIMPNDAVASATIVNITKTGLEYKIHLFVTVAYGTDLTAAKKIMMDVAMAHPHIIKDGSVDMPYTRVTDLEDSDIQLRLSVYVDDYNNSGTIGGELREQMYNAFVAAGIQIPYPQLDVHVNYSKTGNEDTA
jgi:potassium-dependent mechanosensitive channel